jgi:general secretion pathway protein F
MQYSGIIYTDCIIIHHNHNGLNITEMPVFEYTALDAKGKTTSGIIDADGARAARQKLRATGIFPVSIKESQEAPEKKTTRIGDLSLFDVSV